MRSRAAPSAMWQVSSKPPAPESERPSGRPLTAEQATTFLATVADAAHAALYVLAIDHGECGRANCWRSAGRTSTSTLAD